jgi:hypothetical protein
MAKRGRSSRSGSRARSAISGRFVTTAHAARSGRTTVVESTKSSRSSGSHARSAISGRFVTTKHAQRSPRTTVTES